LRLCVLFYVKKYFFTALAPESNKSLQTSDTTICMNNKRKTHNNPAGQGIRIMERKASDNKYLHKDFHVALNHLMNYIYNNFGEDSLRDYLSQYARAFYKPLNHRLKSGNIAELERYITDIYKKEEWNVKVTKGPNHISIEQDACPGIAHIAAKGEKPCVLYRETYDTVYKTLCENTPFEYTLKNFNEETGACIQLFVRKEIKS